jgi:hypothetical protein
MHNEAQYARKNSVDSLQLRIARVTTPHFPSDVDLLRCPSAMNDLASQTLASG